MAVEYVSQHQGVSNHTLTIHIDIEFNCNIDQPRKKNECRLPLKNKEGKGKRKSEHRKGLPEVPLRQIEAEEDSRVQAPRLLDWPQN